jgi:hypothetical protein
MDVNEFLLNKVIHYSFLSALAQEKVEQLEKRIEAQERRKKRKVIREYFSEPVVKRGRGRPKKVQS